MSFQVGGPFILLARIKVGQIAHTKADILLVVEAIEKSLLLLEVVLDLIYLCGTFVFFVYEFDGFLRLFTQFTNLCIQVNLVYFCFTYQGLNSFISLFQLFDSLLIAFGKSLNIFNLLFSVV